MTFINLFLLGGFFCGGMQLVEVGRKDYIGDINKYVLYQEQINYQYFYKTNRLI